MDSSRGGLGGDFAADERAGDGAGGEEEGGGEECATGAVRRTIGRLTTSCDAGERREPAGYSRSGVHSDWTKYSIGGEPLGQGGMGRAAGVDAIDGIGR